ncbi:response regulator [Shewanella sp. WXL01]|uniref:response regulator n=1 Tax=Shewanella sp. WXL01 TaxID=2709721 RepID=UPI001438655B|nr:response regulator [Shewanella sp. WXL01]NKF50529.1 response regulator [Shewanella sp. WXL01]
MNLLKSTSIRTRFLTVLLAVSLLPVSTVSLVITDYVQHTLSNNIFNKLEYVRSAKHSQLKHYINTLHANVSVLAESTTISSSVEAFSSTFDEGVMDEVQYNFFESLEYGDAFKKFLAGYQYYDLMLVNNDGNIIYSVLREDELGQNVQSERFTNTLLPVAYAKGQQGVSITDFGEYWPSADKILSFVSAPITSQYGEIHGVVILKVSNDYVNEVMKQRSGMGETGESLLIGPDYTMRSDAYLDPVNRTVSASFANPELGSIKTEGSIAALQGESGGIITKDYRGVSVLSTYTPIMWGDINFALLVEMDESEAFHAILQTRKIIFVTVIFLAALMAIIAIFLATVLTRPILKLTHASQSIAVGEHTDDVIVKRDDELGTLTNNFNQMKHAINQQLQTIRTQKAALNKSNEDLEAQVKARTADLEESKKRFELAIHGSGDAVWEFEASGKMWFSPRFYEIVGENMIITSREHWHELIHPEDFARTYEAMKAHIFQQQAFNIEFRVYGSNKKLIWFQARAKSLRDEKGIAVRTSGTLTDISYRKKIEHELAETTEKAKLASRAKSDFLANMSHEIRTPMNAIIGMSYLALQTELNSKQQNYIEKVNSSAESLLGIINDILDFSKIEAGKLNIEHTDFNLDDIFDNLANIAGLKAEEKGLELMFQISPQVPKYLLGDPLRLSQILINLTNNAVKFTQQGEVVVKVDAQEIDENSVKLLFSVRDTGVGISPEIQSQLFTSFSQADTSTTRKFGGTGLGLAICKKLTELMDGDIWVDSREGEGSTFHFNLVCDLQTHIFEKQAQFPSADQNKAFHILVVDDNKSSRKILLEMLSVHGFKVDEAISGLKAIDMLVARDKTTPYDLVLMDWKMPEMDGIKAAEIIQTHQQLTHYPTVIMVTAYGKEEAAEAARNINIEGFLTKPVVENQLIAAILSSLGIAYESAPVSKTSKLTDFAISNLEGAKILLVEDNAVNQELAKELLVSSDIEVTVANNGQEALDILETADFDCVLMDCQMPVMDGYEATKAIRQQKKFNKLPIIAMTANAMVGDREKVIACGMNDHVPKPIRVKELFSTLSKWILRSPVVDSLTKFKQFEVSPELLELVPKLPGVDKTLGLNICQNNVDLYLKLLKIFHDNEQHFTENFTQLMLAEDKQSACRMAHSLKGAAGNIGATHIQQAAAKLELACHENKSLEELSSELDLVTSSMAATIADMSEIDFDYLLGAINQASEQSDITQVENLTEEVAKLKQLLETFSTDALSHFELIRGALEGAAGRKTVAKLHRMIDGFEFERAVEHVDQLATKLAE